MELKNCSRLQCRGHSQFNGGAVSSLPAQILNLMDTRIVLGDADFTTCLTGFLRRVNIPAVQI